MFLIELPAWCINIKQTRADSVAITIVCQTSEMRLIIGESIKGWLRISVRMSMHLSPTEKNSGDNGVILGNLGSKLPSVQIGRQKWSGQQDYIYHDWSVSWEDMRPLNVVVQWW